MPEFPKPTTASLQGSKALAMARRGLNFWGSTSRVYRMARRRGLQDADAHDVMQQVFVSIAGAIDRWEPDASKPPFRAWLSTISGNAITKALSRRPRDRASGSTSVFAAINAHPEPDAHARDAAEMQLEAKKEMVR